jgi:potassium channel subfamily K
MLLDFVEHKRRTGFIAFTTIGYGDLAPQTAIGRSIFVFWALFGVGAMTILIAGTFLNYRSSAVTVQCASVLSDAFSSKYHSVTQDKKFDRAVRRYRQGQEKAAQRREREHRVSRKRRSSQVVPALRASLARISSREPALPSIVQQPVLQPALTVAEAEARLRSRIEPLPAMILKEVLKLRDHTRYFLIANGHAEALSLQGGPSALAMQRDNAVPEDLKHLLDEIAQEEGFEERLKQEVWDDTHARNVGVLGYA